MLVATLVASGGERWGVSEAAEGEHCERGHRIGNRCAQGARCPHRMSHSRGTEYCQSNVGPISERPAPCFTHLPPSLLPASDPPTLNFAFHPQVQNTMGWTPAGACSSVTVVTTDPPSHIPPPSYAPPYSMQVRSTAGSASRSRPPSAGRPRSPRSPGPRSLRTRRSCAPRTWRAR